MFLVNSRQASLAAAHVFKHGQTISLSYGRCFAEFLNEGSPIHLGLLALSTCVGFGTVTISLTLEAFPGILLIFVFSAETEIPVVSWAYVDGFTNSTPSIPLPESNNRQRLLKYVTPSNNIVV